jgi:hypothetical protein
MALKFRSFIRIGLSSTWKNFYANINSASMKYITFLILICICKGIGAQVIPPHFFGQNAWMSDTLGNIKDCKGAEKGLKCKLYGKIHQNNTWEKVRLSGVKLVRFGGEHADENMPTRHQYLQMVDSARSKGMEPLLQVPYNNNYYTADTAAELVKFINVTMKRNVRYWSIGNEPDLSPPNGYGYYSASPVADYTKQFAVKMKAVDSTIITLGPELTYYDDTNRLISELTTAGGYYDITGRVPGHSYYYIDIITFHSYPFSGNQTRQEVITNLRDPWHISNMLDKLNARLDTCNQYHNRTGKNALKIALTETNLNYRNSSDPELNAHSFIAGQFWCELMGVGLEKNVEFIAFWSIIETSLGYIDENTFKVWPTYYHYQLLATNLKGKYYKTETSAAAPELKVIVAADSSTITVMLMNQKNQGRNYRYSLQMGDGKIIDRSKVRLSIKDIDDLKRTIVYNDSLEDESTNLLVFDFSGQLLKKYVYRKKDKAPHLVKDPARPYYVSAGPDITVPKNKEIILRAGTSQKNAVCTWYEGESDTPLQPKPANTYKTTATKSTMYRLVVNYDGCIIEDCVTVEVGN